MTKRGKWTLDAKTGKWREGAASPRLEPAHMRDKPGELLTREIEEGDKIHEEDPQHIVDSILDDWEAQDKPKPKMDPGRMEILRKLSLDRAEKHLRLSDLGEERRQLEIDIVRMRILFTLVDTYVKQMEEGLDVDPDEVHHVWFPSNQLGVYELRKGPAGHHSNRPKWLKGMELELDLNNPPRRGMDLLKEAGVDIEKRWPKADLN